MATRCDEVRRAGAVALPPLPPLLGPVQVAEFAVKSLVQRTQAGLGVLHRYRPVPVLDGQTS